MRQTRRAMLARCGALVAATGIAGCLEGDEPDDEGSEGALEGRFLAPPDALGLDHYGFKVTRLGALADHRDALSASIREDLDTEVDAAGFGTFGDLDVYHQLANAVKVYEGDHDVAATVEQLEGDGFAEGDGHRGSRLFEGEGARTAAVGEDLFVLADGRTRDLADAGDVVRAVLDAGAGEGERYVDADDDLARLAEELGDGDVVLGKTIGEEGRTVDGTRAEGAGWTVDGSTIDAVVAMVFDDEAATAAGAVEFWATTAGPFVGMEPSIGTEGRVVTATGERATDGVRTFNPGIGGIPGAPAAPRATFQFAYDEPPGTVEVTLQSGGPLASENVYVRGRGFADRADADQTEAGPWAGETDEEDGSVQAGHAVTVGVTPSYELAVVWETDAGSGLLDVGSGPEV